MIACLQYMSEITLGKADLVPNDLKKNEINFDLGFN
jgi:hypothetical protein